MAGRQQKTTVLYNVLPILVQTGNYHLAVFSKQSVQAVFLDTV